MTPEEIKPGRVYRAKKPGLAGGMYVNDRQTLHVTATRVQYDGPAVANGRRYPSAPLEEFAAWAGSDVTGQLPPHDWAPWPPTFSVDE